MKLDEPAIREAVGRLAALPTSVTSLAAVTGSPDFDFADIVDIVERDMVLAGGVLRVANSAESSAASRIDTVRDAVVRIGPARTLAAAMHTVVAGQLQAPLAVYGIAHGALGEHSTAAWIAAELIRTAVHSSVQLPASVGTAALLHDVGKLVCSSLAAGLSLEDGLLDGRDAVGLCEAENELFGADHAAIGAVVAAYWNLPPAIVTGIADHHHAIDDPIALAVSLADDVAHAVASGELSDEAGTARRASALGLPLDAVLGLVDAASERLAAFDVAMMRGSTP